MEAETRREKVRKVGGRGMKSAGKAQDKRERKNKQALAGRIPKKIGNRQNLPGKRPEDCQKRKNRKRRNQADENRPRSWTGRPGGRKTGRPENRKIGKPGWDGKIRNGRNRKVETEKIISRRRTPRAEKRPGGAGAETGKEEKRRECRSGADGVEKRVLKL